MRLWGAAFTGCLQRPVAHWERLRAFVAGGSLILAAPITDELGFVLAALFFARHLWRARRAGATAA